MPPQSRTVRPAVRSNLRSSGISNPPVPQSNNTVQPKSSKTLLMLVLQETRSVSAWTFLATILRIMLSILIQVSNYRKDCISEEHCVSQIPRNIYLNLSVFADFVLSICPSKVATETAPGFIYAFGGLLFFVRKTFGAIPNLTLRICEMMMGRIT